MKNKDVQVLIFMTLFSVFPTHVGVSLQSVEYLRLLTRFPYACRGEPGVRERTTKVLRFSLRM